MEVRPHSVLEAPPSQVRLLLQLSAYRWRITGFHHSPVFLLLLHLSPLTPMSRWACRCPFFGPLHFLKVRETRKKSPADRLRHLLTRLQQRRSVSLLLRSRLCGGESHIVQGSPTGRSRTQVSGKNGEDIHLSGLHQHLTQRW